MASLGEKTSLECRAALESDKKVSLILSLRQEDRYLTYKHQIFEYLTHFKSFKLFKYLKFEIFQTVYKANTVIPRFFKRKVISPMP